MEEALDCFHKSQPGGRRAPRRPPKGGRGALEGKEDPWRVSGEWRGSQRAEGDPRRWRGPWVVQISAWRGPPREERAPGGRGILEGRGSWSRVWMGVHRGMRGNPDDGALREEEAGRQRVALESGGDPREQREGPRVEC